MEGNEKSFNKGFLNKGFLNKSVGNVKNDDGVPGAQNDKDAGVTKPATVNVTASLNEKKNPLSYASAVNNTSAARKVNFRELAVESSVVGADVVIPRSAVEAVNNRFVNTLYGFFLGNRLAFPIVENYVKNTWGKFGLRKVMMNNMGYFFFKFDSKTGLDQVLEKGPWLIRSVPILLNVWSPNSSLSKKEISDISVWVRMHDVPLAAFNEDGLSMIATKVGKPVLLDSFSTSMCADSWGRQGYARALIQVNASTVLRQEVIVAIPYLTNEGCSMESVRIEYEWTPPRCNECKIFGHSDEQCPSRCLKGKEKQQVDVKADDFVPVVHNKVKKKKQPLARQVVGVHLNKPKPNFAYRVKSKMAPLKHAEVVSNKASTSKVSDSIHLQNSYAALKDFGSHEEPLLKEIDPNAMPDVEPSKPNGENGDSDEDEVVSVFDESMDYMAKPEGGDHKVPRSVGGDGSGGASLYSQFKQCDYSDDDEDEVYDLDADEISEIHRAFCKTMDLTLKDRHRK